MGMSVSGKSGNHFYNNIWWWHPLADYIEQTAPDIANKNPYWHYNECTGLNETDSIALADKLQEEIDSGRCHQYAREYATQPHSDSEPEKTRHLLENAKGSWAHDTLAEHYSLENAKGKTWAEHHSSKLRFDSCHFTVENVQRFVNFLRRSRGFTIF